VPAFVSLFHLNQYQVNPTLSINSMCNRPWAFESAEHLMLMQELDYIRLNVTFGLNLLWWMKQLIFSFQL